MGIFELLVVVVLSVLGPIIGSWIGVLKKPNDSFIFNMLAFAAGVMLAISFMELIPTAIALGSIEIALIGVLVGSIFMFFLESIIPKINEQFNLVESYHHHNKLDKKTPLYLLVGMFFHNFPEGMAIAIGFVTNISLTFTIAIAIALHHIPEGISTSAPYYALTKKKWKSFLVSSITAIPTLVGFVFAYFLYNFIPLSFVGFISAITAGVMIYIAGDELIPSSCHRITNKKTIFALVLGVLFVLGLKIVF